jgi:hypothetical protein
MKGNDKLQYCMKATNDCLSKMKVVDENGEILRKFAQDYYNDAVHYLFKDPETALEAVAYAHGFIDAGVLLGYLEIPGYHLKEQKVKKGP